MCGGDGYVLCCCVVIIDGVGVVELMFHQCDLIMCAVIMMILND